MSRHIQDPRAFCESRYLPDPRPLKSRTIPTDPYAGDRYLTEHQMLNSRIVSTDPASYSYSTANSDGWRGRRPFEESLTYEGEYGPQYLDSLTLPPIRGNPQPTTSLGHRDTGRSVQNSHHFNRPEERASERHAPTAYGFREIRSSGERTSPTAYGFREIRSSEGRGSGKSGEGVTSRTYEFHANTFDTIEQQPRNSQRYAEERETRAYHFYSEKEDNDIINYIKAGNRWRQIGQKMGRDKRSISAHWFNGLNKDPRAQGVKYKYAYGK